MKKYTKFQKEKKCNKCRKVKPAKDFSPRGGRSPFSLLACCKECCVKKTQIWVDKNRLKYNKYQLKYKKNAKD